MTAPRLAIAVLLLAGCPTFNNNSIVVVTGSDGSSDSAPADAGPDAFDAGPVCAVNPGWRVEGPTCPSAPRCLYKCNELSPNNDQVQPLTDCVLPTNLGNVYCGGLACDGCPAWTMTP